MNKVAAFYESPLRISDKNLTENVSFKMVRPLNVENITIFGSAYTLKLTCQFDVPLNQRFYSWMGLTYKEPWVSFILALPLLQFFTRILNTKFLPLITRLLGNYCTVFVLLKPHVCT